MIDQVWLDMVLDLRAGLEFQITKHVDFSGGGPMSLGEGETVSFRWWLPEDIEKSASLDLVGGPIHPATPIRVVKRGEHKGRAWLASLDLTPEFLNSADIYEKLEAEFRGILVGMLAREEESLPPP